MQLAFHPCMETFIKGREWSLLTPLEWAASGFEIRLVESHESRRTDSEIEGLIEENWEDRQAERKRNGIFVEEPWPKTGYRRHQLDLENRVITIVVNQANWKSMQGTDFNPKFFEVMLKRFNERSLRELSLPSCHEDPAFQNFIRPYLDGAMSQCAAVETKSGYPLGLRSDEVGVAPGVWHVPGGYLPGIGEGIYKSKVPEVDGKPIVARRIFTLDADSLKDNAKVNLYKESGSQLSRARAEIVYTGLAYELPSHSIEFLSVIRTDLDSFGTNWEHVEGKMRHYKLEDLPGLLNHPDALPGGVLNAAEAALSVAYIQKRGLGSVGELKFLSKI